jgi:hypothetical protein
MLYYENFSLEPTSMEVQRTAYDIFDVCGDIGGVIQVFIAVAAFILNPYARLCYEFEAILTLFTIKTLKRIKKPTSCQKWRLLINLFPSKIHKKGHEIGLNYFHKQMDLVYILN